MAKKPAKKPAAKRGGAKKPAPQGGKAKAKTPRGQVERHGKAKAAEREWGRKPTARSRNSALPHYDPLDVAFKRDDPQRHPTVEEQYLSDLKAAARVATVSVDAGPTKPRRYRFRDAITGLFIRAKDALRRAATTVRERVG